MKVYPLLLFIIVIIWIKRVMYLLLSTKSCKCIYKIVKKNFFFTLLPFFSIVETAIYISIQYLG